MVTICSKGMYINYYKKGEGCEVDKRDKSCNENDYLANIKMMVSLMFCDFMKLFP